MNNRDSYGYEANSRRLSDNKNRRIVFLSILLNILLFVTFCYLLLDDSKIDPKISYYNLHLDEPNQEKSNPTNPYQDPHPPPSEEKPSNPNVPNQEENNPTPTSQDPHSTPPEEESKEEPKDEPEESEEEPNPPRPSHVPHAIDEFNPRSTQVKSTFDFLSRELKKISQTELEGSSSFLRKGGIIPFRDIRPVTMCKMGIKKLCQSKYIADVIDLLYSFSPIYSWWDPNSMPRLYQNHLYFRDYMLSFGISVVVLEAIYPGQTYKVTTAGKEPWEIQLKIEDAFYYRENFLNVAARKTDKWEYLLWIDGHQFFENSYWWEDSIRKLEKYGTVQLFQYLYYRREGNFTDMNVNYAGIQYAGWLTTPFYKYFETSRGLWAGNAWGVRKEVYNEMGYILDTCVAGWCDSIYNIPTFKDLQDWVLYTFPGYKRNLFPWVEHTSEVFKKYGIGPAIIRGNIVHFDHERWSKAEIERAQAAFARGDYKMSEDLYRDENFTLHSREGSPTAALFTKRKWT